MNWHNCPHCEKEFACNHGIWIDPNDKTQERFLPNIGEPILFCHGGKTYYGRHTGGSFQYGAGVTKRDFNTWECRWAYLPEAVA